MHSTHPTMTTANQRDRRDHHPQKISGQENKRVTLPPIRDVFPDLFANTHHHSNDVRVIGTSDKTVRISPADARSSSSASPGRDSATPDGTPDESAVDDEGNEGASANKLRYACAACDRKFARPSSLRTHQTTHTGERPFTCPIEGCGRTYTVKSNMRRHLLKHPEYDGQDTEDTQPIRPHDPYAFHRGVHEA